MQCQPIYYLQANCPAHLPLDRRGPPSKPMPAIFKQAMHNMQDAMLDASCRAVEEKSVATGVLTKTRYGASHRNFGSTSTLPFMFD